MPVYPLLLSSLSAASDALSADGILRVAAPMKINLALHILGQRADGYHDLQSLVAFSGAGDALEFRPAARDRFYTDGAYAAHLGKMRHNLVLRARDALRALLGAKAVPPVAIRLTKNLPVAAGLGGGSADAAACVAGLCALAALNNESARVLKIPSKAALLRLGAALGADVPMCLAWFYQKSAFIARAKGEQLSVLPQFPALPAVVVNNGARLSTACVFNGLKNKNNAPFSEALAAQSQSLPQAIEFLQTLRNDLYPAALAAAPALADVPALLQASGAACCAMSGSGASCFGIYLDWAAAVKAAAFIKSAQPHFFVAAVQTDGAALP